MASLTQWTWVWASSRSWWWTGKPGMLQSTGSQKAGYERATELNLKYTLQKYIICNWLNLRMWISRYRRPTIKLNSDFWVYRVGSLIPALFKDQLYISFSLYIYWETERYIYTYTYACTPTLYVKHAPTHIYIQLVNRE